MKIVQKKIAELHPYAKNPRKNDHAIDAVARAITAYGFNVPILARADGEIIDGHLRYKAAQKAGLDKVPVIVADHLSEEEIKAFRLSVNKVAELAEWDQKLLEDEIAEIQGLCDLGDIGFSEREIEDLLGDITAVKIIDEKLDEAPAPPEKPVSVPGDVWECGQHVLVVGDSTRAETYAELLGEDKADMVFTDPPYNVDYSGKAGKIMNDKKGAEEFSLFLRGFFKATHASMKQGAPIYVCFADGTESSLDFRREFNSQFKFSAVLIWLKNSPVLSRGDYHHNHEPILYGWKPGRPHFWYGDRKRKTVTDIVFSDISEDDGSVQFTHNSDLITVSGENISIDSNQSSVRRYKKPVSSKLHPTMKPVQLIEDFLVNSSRKGDIVLDPFGGSGSTMIACEERGRRARLIELDPHYADVIVRRWQEQTGGGGCSSKRSNVV